MNKKKVVIALSIVFVILVILSYPGKMPYSLKAVGKVVHHREWVVRSDPNGPLRAALYDNTKGSVEDYFITELERGDAVRLQMNRSIMPGATITKGDTVCWIESNEITRQLAILNRELDTQKATLTFALAGEKESVITEAIQLVDHARQALEEQEKIVDRQKALYETSFIPYQDYEISLSTLKLFAINVQIAETQLQQVQTGVKPEEIDMISAQIDGLENEINTLLERSEDFTLTSPLSGIVLDSTSGDTLVVIGDTSAYTVVIPLKLEVRSQVTLDQEVTCTIDGITTPYHGRISHIGNVAHILNGQQVILAKARLELKGNDIITGTFARCAIKCEPVTIRQYIVKSINTVFK